MKQFPWICFLLVFSVCSARAADESIDRLISKLPPPQKLVDPAISDPLEKQIQSAMQAHNFGVALDLSRRLSTRYPKSLNAQMIHGLIALSVREFKEAANAYHAAISIRPDFPGTYVGLGIVDASQNRFAAALADFQRVSRLAPQADVGWIGSSACAEKLGRMKDSLAFARKATQVAPSSAGAWVQAAHEEGLAGNAQVAQADLAKANQLRLNATKAKAK